MHSGTGKALISRFHWILQRTPKSVLFSRLAIGPSTNNPDKVREQGFSALYGPQANEVTQEIPNKTLLMHCAAALFVCLLVFGSPLFFFLPFSFLEYRGRYLNIPKVCRTCSPACHVFLFPDMPLPLSLSKAKAHCLATNKLLRSAQTKTGLKT